MRRVATLLVLLAAGAGFFVLAGGAAEDQKGKEFKVELDNAFANIEGVVKPIPVPLRPGAAAGTTATGQRNRCPGGAELPALDKSNPWKPTPDHNCDPSQVFPGSR